MYNKQHLISLFGYLGIGFIGGAISHGFFSGTRSMIMAVVGIILFIISEHLKDEQKDYIHLIFGGLIYSIAVGMVSGGFQHLLDSPMRSLWIIPVGWLISTAIFPYKEGITNYNRKKSMLTGLLISIVLCVLTRLSLRIIPADRFMAGHH